eukprot:2047964-Prorocentrum_lima.AAC.1
MLSVLLPRPLAPWQSSSREHPSKIMPQTAVRGSAHGVFPLRGVLETMMMMMNMLLLPLLKLVGEV